MVLPRWLARFNRSVTNPVLGLLPRRWSPFVIVYHRGRRSGKPYATLAAAFATEDGFVLTPTYGPDADWVRNILASESFIIERRGVTHQLADARLVPRAGAWPHLPGFVRLAMKILKVEWFVRADR